VKNVKIEPSIEEKCKEFKAQLLSMGATSARMRIDNLENFFSYSANSLVSAYIPRRIKDSLREIGVHLRKERGRDIVEVTVDE
jgi:hypothetical protein